MTKIWSSRHLPKFSRIRSSKYRTKFDYIQLSRLWSKIDHIQSSRSRTTNLVESTLIKFDWSGPDSNVAIFGQVHSGQNLVVLGKIDPGQNSVEFSQLDLDWDFVESTLAQIWSRRPQPKFIRKSSKFIPCWNLTSLASTKNLPNSLMLALSKI